MGVPSFYKWLVGKYPNIVVSVKEDDDSGSGEGRINGVYHNLYLDMNGIIHPCFHPEDQVCPPTTFDEVFQAMFEYMDRLFLIVRPTKLLYLAVDGVAPRAKMNQQRSRRFKAAKDAKEAEIEEHLLRERFSAAGKEVLPKETNEVSDPNVITPGTEFMEKLSKALEYYIRLRLNTDPGWKDIKFLNIWVLREYLELDLKILNPIFKTDIDKLVDDFIFICFLTGNDFIPHIPSLEIREDAIDLLIEVYKANFNKMGGYIVNREKVKEKHAAYLKVSRLEKFFHELSLCEEKIFVKRYELRESHQRKILRQAAEKEWNERNLEDAEENPDGSDLMVKAFPTECSILACSSEKSDITGNTLELRRNLKDALRKKQDLIKTGACNHDRIRLGFAGWKSRFYREKFGIENYNEVAKLKGNMGIALLPFIDEKLLLSATKTVENNLAMHEMNRNTVRQEKIFLRNTNSLAGSMQTSDRSSIKHPIDPSTRSLMFFNPEPVKPIPKLLDHVNVPEKTLTESDISRKPLWHTYPGYRPPVTTSSMEAQPRISSFSRGRGSAVYAETPQQSIIGSSRGRGFTFQPFNSGGAYSPWPAGSAWAGRGQYGGGTFQTQQVAWRPVEQWSRGGSGGGGRNGGGRGGSGQSRGW
ncbi:hypothetical protein QOZ80_9BG0699040 [Eleusine coracana subsp. coracana]|nr:hypothetical protein QOZ80_9BG0699040 [Eleusine coracana subsp. coracana]